uniref:Uncharacterized protein n=1 Tax=Aegilops tauschii subsp. strangulata TaxID=200361 RepID=A0A453QQ46_AEGTS
MFVEPGDLALPILVAVKPLPLLWHNFILVMWHI